MEYTESGRNRANFKGRSLLESALRLPAAIVLQPLHPIADFKAAFSKLPEF